MPPVRVVRSVFRGLLGHAVLVKSCTIETSAAAISRILASIGEKISRFVARLRNKCHVSPRWPHRRSIASFISTRIPRSVFVTRYLRSWKSGSNSFCRRGKERRSDRPHKSNFRSTLFINSRFSRVSALAKMIVRLHMVLNIGQLR